MIDPNGILMVEPRGQASNAPVLDTLTRKMTAAWRARYNEPLRYYKGCHTCVCGVHSDNMDHWVGPEQRLTNSLCVHYLAFHRADIPAEELTKVAAFTEQAEPSAEELAAPGLRRQAAYTYRR